MRGQQGGADVESVSASALVCRHTRARSPLPRFARYAGNSVRRYGNGATPATCSFEILPVAEESARAARRRAERAHGPRFVAPGSADRSRPPERSARAAGRRVRERDRPPAPRRADTIAGAGATAMPPARAPERDGDGHTSSFSSRPRTRRRSARSPASRCPRVLATAASAAAATPRSEAAQVHAGPRPPNQRPRGCARRATASDERRARVRARASKAPPTDTAPAPATARASSTLAPLAIAAIAALTAAGTADGARSSTRALPDRGSLTIDHPPMFPPTQDASR